MKTIYVYAIFSVFDKANIFKSSLTIKVLSEMGLYTLHNYCFSGLFNISILSFKMFIFKG